MTQTSNYKQWTFKLPLVKLKIKKGEQQMEKVGMIYKP